jgi:hypothetical protein
MKLQNISYYKLRVAFRTGLPLLPGALLISSSMYLVPPRLCIMLIMQMKLWNI